MTSFDDTQQETNHEMQEEDLVDDAAADTKTTSAPRLSKAWAIESAHVPIYTGGKVTPCHLHRPPKNGSEAEENQMEEEEDESSDDEETSTIPCLLVPVSGDVAIVDAQRGLKLGSVRESGSDNQNDQQDEEDDGIDADAITAYALSNNQSCLVTCTHNHLIQQYALDTATTTNGRHKISFAFQKSWGRSGHSLPVTNMEFHKSGVFVATASVDGTVRIWDARGGHVTHVYRPIAGGSGGGSGRLSVTSIRWLEDTVHLILAIGRDDGSIAIHDLRDQDMKYVVMLRDHMSAITCMEWWWKGDEESHQSRPYPSMFVTAARDAVLNVWRIEEAEEPSTSKKGKKKKKSKQQTDLTGSIKAHRYHRMHTLPIYEQIEGMVILPNDDDHHKMKVATAGSKGIVRIWESNETDQGQMSALAVSAEQVSSEAYGEARGGYLGLHFMATQVVDDEGYLIASDAEHCLSFLSASDIQDDKLTTNRTIVGYNDEVLDLKVIPTLDAASKVSQIVVATNSAQVRIFDLDSFSCHVLDEHTATVLCVDVSPCGRYIATCGKDKKMCLWHTESRKCIATAVGHTEAVGATALSKKAGRYDVRGKTARNGAGSFAVTASLDRTLKRWNLPGNAELEASATSESQTLSLDAFVSVRAHEKDINVVSIAPNDSLVATGSQDKTVKLWRATDLHLMATLKGHRRGVWDCQFSPFDRVVATASGDRSIRVWSLSDYSCVRTFQGHVASVLRVRYLNGGLQLVSSGADGLIKLWTIRTNECEATMDAHHDKVWALDVAPAGTTMISGSADSQLLVWKDTTEEVEDEKRAQREEAILMDQRLANHLRHKEFSQALDIALQLDKPRLTLKVLTSIIETDVKEKRSPISSLQQYIPSWSMERVAQVLKYCREWNTRARNCDVANLAIRAIVSILPAEDLATAEGIPEILAGVTPYAERHFDRLERLFTSSYLLDFALFSAGSLEAPTKDDFSIWEAQSKLVLPPVYVEGKTQVGGKAIVGGRPQVSKNLDSDEEVSTVGDSDSSDDEEDNNSTHGQNKKGAAKSNQSTDEDSSDESQTASGSDDTDENLDS